MTKSFTAGLLALGLVLAGCQSAAPKKPAPDPAAPKYKNAALPVAERVADLMGLMSLEQKLGQMTQVDWVFLGNRNDLAKYHIGSVFSGGDSMPNPNNAENWAKLHDELQEIALHDELGIPLLIGHDGVHGQSKVVGATIFPHNIGLGATRNPALVKRIGEITAAEMLATGANWNFAPTIAVVRNERWGRTYEGFGEETGLVASMTEIVSGIQGAGVLATAKHYIGDGATEGGKDQGDTRMTEAQIRSLLLPPYVSALEKGAGSVMVSFSSVSGDKMHGHTRLITDVLKGELKFGGLVVSDYAGVDQISKDYAVAVRTAINAGVDMVMVPQHYGKFIDTLKAEVKAGRVSQARIDDAVRRILTVKFQQGLFEKPMARRDLLPQVGSAEHRAVARDAVRQSAVLLKNEGGVLPLKKGAGKIYVAGKNADDIGNQCGGWTITWQGKSGKITTGTTILEGIRQAAGGATVTFDPGAGTIDSSYSAAVVVIGEKPYAEFQGDRTGSMGLDKEDLDVLVRVKATGVPTVVVLVSGRPLVVTEQLKDWRALLAVWLPGTEGTGVADVLFGDYKPTGKLPMTWPRSELQIPINVGDPNYDPLFAFGFGLTYP
ncbi:MAG TPA: glycoside hydrolase family 3 N-terminal domain-containing protein [Symbiobacteriaceae bacterium]|nr:glycoside hydrolase family 3 N-terminal domain-containing protein [Symbiobacteriaceae bacterium]